VKLQIFGLLALSVFLTLQVHSCLAQSDEQSEGTRRVTNKVVPSYPQMARSMRLEGTVKMEVLVLANGTV